MADHQFHSASLESGSTSAEEISSSTEKLDQVLHHHPAAAGSEPPIDHSSSPVWEGWTPLKIISSSSTHPPPPPLVMQQDQTTSHSTMSSETYTHHHHHHPPPDSLILSANWNLTSSSSSMVTQPAPISSGSAMACYNNMDQNMKHHHPPNNTTTGSSSSSPSSFGALMSPTRFPPSTDHNSSAGGPTRFDPGSSASSEHSSFIFSELMRSMRNNVEVNPVTSSRGEGCTASRGHHHHHHQQHIVHPAAAEGGDSDTYNKYGQGKSYEEEGSLQFSNFGAVPSKLVTGTESAAASDPGKAYDEGGSLQFPSFGGSKAVVGAADQGKCYEEEEGSLQFSSFGGSKVVGTDSAANSHHQNLVLQLPISPESPISPLDLNNVVQHQQHQQQQQQQHISVKDQTLSMHPAGEAWPASSVSIGQQELSEGLHHFSSRHRGEAANYSNHFYNGNNNNSTTSTLAMRFSLEGGGHHHHHHHHHHPSPDLESSPRFHLDEYPAQRSSSKLGRRSLDTEAMMNNSIPLPSSVLLQSSSSPVVPWSQLISSSDMIMSHGVHHNSTLPNHITTGTTTDCNVQYQTFSGTTCTSNSSSARGKSKMGINPVGSIKGARVESSSMSGNKRSCFEIIKKPAQAAKDKVCLTYLTRSGLI
jgi:hypothetical protein